MSDEKTDILRFWEVWLQLLNGVITHFLCKANKMEFPTLFAMAMDYLPIQATSVPCERVFSSAKETDTAKRNRISPVLMEAIQLLKFSLKTERLDFMEGRITSLAVMNEAPKPTWNLDSLFAGDADTALDKILDELSDYDYEAASTDSLPK